MAPPYFMLDEAELLSHFEAAARACAPTPFYVYEFAARSGYPVPVPVIERLREAAPNFRGLKVSDTPWERFAPYLIEGLDVFVGPEANRRPARRPILGQGPAPFSCDGGARQKEHCLGLYRRLRAGRRLETGTAQSVL